MTKVITATYDGEVLRPEEKLELAPGARVRLTVSNWSETTQQRKEALEEFNRLCDEVRIDSGGDRLTRDQLHERR